MTESRDQLTDVVRTIVSAGRAKQVSINAIGGLGIQLRAGAAVPELERPYGDIDLVCRPRDRQAVERCLSENGFGPDSQFNKLRGHKRQIWWRPESEMHVDLFLGRFEMCHRLDLADRLDPDHPAMPAADLLLTKLQIVELSEKDVIDMARLLLTHTPAESDGIGLIALPRLGSVLASDWGLFTTVTDNLTRLGSSFTGLGLADAKSSIATERAAQISSHLCELPKARAFKLRAHVGRRKRWYALPEESIPS